MNGTNWTPAEDEHLQALYRNGASFAEMARIVGRTKNSCISRSRRLKFPPRTKPRLEQIRATKALHRPKPKSDKRRPPMFLRIVTAPDSKPVGLIERTGCCYPTTKEGPHLFCNANTNGSDYCEFHLQVMYPRRRAA